MEKLGITGESYSTIEGYIKNGISNGAESTLSKIYESVRDTDKEEAQTKKTALEEATDEYFKAKKKFDQGELSTEEFNAAKDKLVTAQTDYANIAGTDNARKVVVDKAIEKGYSDNSGILTTDGNTAYNKSGYTQNEEAVEGITNAKKTYTLGKLLKNKPDLTISELMDSIQTGDNSTKAAYLAMDLGFEYSGNLFNAVGIDNADELSKMKEKYGELTIDEFFNTIYPGTTNSYDAYAAIMNDANN